MKTYFTIKELSYSKTAEEKHINNSPDINIQKHLEELIKFLNPLREAWGKPILVSSGFRCPELNKAVNGSETSAHLTGYAVDLVPKDMKDWNNFITFLKDYLKDKLFDQFIIETSGSFKWVHLGLYNNKNQQRRMMFNIIK